MKRILIRLGSLGLRYSDIKPGPVRATKLDDIVELNARLHLGLCDAFGDYVIAFYRHPVEPFWLPKNYIFGAEHGDELYAEAKAWNENLRTTCETADKRASDAAPQDRNYARFLAGEMRRQLDGVPTPYGYQFVADQGRFCPVLSPEQLESVRLNPADWAMLTIQTPMS